LGFFGQLCGVLFFQDAGESINMAQGGAKVVGDGIAKCFELLVRGG
jgi:hypothetical protein